MPTLREWILKTSKAMEYWKIFGGILKDLYNGSSVGADV